MADTPTLDPQEGETSISDNQPSGVSEEDKRQIVATLNTYKQEAIQSRMSGENPRDEKWRENLNLYWNRYDFSRKAAWQAKEVMPEVPAFVDRFAGALKEALMSTQGDLYEIEDDTDTEGDMTDAIKRMTDMWLTKVGRNQNGTILGFPSVFEDQMKLGALMATSSVVTWKEDIPNGRVAIEDVDPRNVWLDHTYRNLYRIRRIEIDKHELQSMVKQKDSSGQPIFNIEDIDQLVTSIMMDEQKKREEITGGGAQIVSSRSPIILDEYLATVTDPQGNKSYDKALFVVANDQHLIRGPEANPFWHKKDWLVFAPLVNVPLSVYGRSYMEDFGSVAKTFTNLTNMLLDAVHTSTLNAWAIVPSMLIDPGQLAEGVTPNKMFNIEEGYNPKEFAEQLSMGTLNADALRVWQMLKEELTEAAQLNEIGLGQFAPKGRTSATEVMHTQQSSSAMVRSIADIVEVRWLNPTLDLVWKTGMQHMKKGDKILAAAAGEEMYGALYAKRKELVTRPMTFRAQGLSAMIQRAQTLKAILAVFQIVGSNQVLAQQFMQKVDMGRFVDLLFKLNGVDVKKLQASDREKMIAQVTQPLQGMQQAAAGTNPGPAADEMGSLASTLNVGGGQ